MIRIRKCRRKANTWVVFWRPGDGYVRSREFESYCAAEAYRLKLNCRLDLDFFREASRGVFQ